MAKVRQIDAKKELFEFARKHCGIPEDVMIMAVSVECSRGTKGYVEINPTVLPTKLESKECRHGMPLEHHCNRCSDSGVDPRSGGEDKA